MAFTALQPNKLSSPYEPVYRYTSQNGIYRIATVPGRVAVGPGIELHIAEWHLPHCKNGNLSRQVTHRKMAFTALQPRKAKYSSYSSSQKAAKNGGDYKKSMACFRSALQDQFLSAAISQNVFCLETGFICEIDCNAVSAILDSPRRICVTRHSQRAWQAFVSGYVGLVMTPRDASSVPGNCRYLIKRPLAVVVGVGSLTSQANIVERRGSDGQPEPVTRNKMRRVWGEPGVSRNPPKI